VLLLPVSAETVRRTLRQQQLIGPRRKKPPRNPPKPRFFERATPNQLWQTDIFTFRLGGKQAYLIGFLDDYSRYVAGLDLFRSQTAEHVLEVYRTAVAEYGVPKELLSDQGRQFSSWRGTTRFEQELKKDRVHHLKSRPHHPMTLGKIERFWKTIWEEFLVRAQFDSFEQARDRIRLWVKYYNHKRPHQSLEGLCPADRFFEIARELRATIERGIAENVQELALRGQPQAPFYMVGRLGQQSVVIRAEKGQLKMLVDGPEPSAAAARELNYELKPTTLNTGARDEQREQNEEGSQRAQRPATGGRGAGGVDGAAHVGAGVQGDEHPPIPVEPVATPGDSGLAVGADAAGPAPSGAGPGAESETGPITGQTGGPAAGASGEAGEAAGADRGGADRYSDGQRVVSWEAPDEPAIPSAGVGDGAPSGAVDSASAERRLERAASGPADGPLAQELLQVGAAGLGGDGGGVERAGPWPAEDAEGSGERNPAAASSTPAGETPGARTDAGDPPAVGGA
jgi:transposase InsO family protein